MRALVGTALLGCAPPLPEVQPGSGGSNTTTDHGLTLGETAATTAMTSLNNTSTLTGDDEGSGTTGGELEPPGIHWVGRHDDSDTAAVRLGWSGTGAIFRFDGTSASFRADDRAGYFTVVVDGVVQSRLITSPGLQTYTLADGLPFGPHTVEFYRRTEGQFGPTVVYGVDTDGPLLSPPPVTRRIEIIGDSMTTGYGNEGTPPCEFTADTENHYLTYASIAARTLNAELSTIAWSGKGLIYNFDRDVAEPMSEIYRRTVPTETTSWCFDWQADAVVINLGTNDFSTDNDPSQELFVSTYVQLLTELRAAYPQAFLLPVTPVLSDSDADTATAYIHEAVQQRNSTGDARLAIADINVQWVGSGCNNHPSLATHEAMATRLVVELQAHLGW